MDTKSPPQHFQLDMQDSVNVICPRSSDTWLMGCGKHLLQVQLNSASLTLLWSVECGDEINSVDINDKQTCCAVADDTGSVSLIDLKSGKMHKKLSGHDNICQCVKFRPKSPWCLLSGGLDCMLFLWDFKKGQALASVNMADEIRKGEVESEKSSYVVNPPLIHSLCITADGLIAAVGLENGKIMLFTIGGKGLKLASCFDAHSQGVSSLGLTNDLTLVSAGNDTRIVVWALSTARAPGKTLVWANELHSITHAEKPSGIQILNESKRIIVADETETVKIYDYS
ncbi:WDR53 [Bugula neritina]|uniref:WDR53 n=1 Tax=Bugula neritina TaxID=10212 RepID=A0A7J7IWM7_BUGNE|nr:WDR53 [Bugula neritina]